jgi:hypothetical protein
MKKRLQRSARIASGTMKGKWEEISLEMTQETRLFLNGERRGVELLERMEVGRTAATITVP